MIEIEQLDNFVKFKKPTDVETVFYIFWDKGISYNEFCELPLPYIFSILKVHNYVKREEEKAYKKAQRKK